MSNETKLFRLSGSALVIDLRTGHNATLRPGLVVLSEDAHTHAMGALEAECERWKERCQYNADTAHAVATERDALHTQLEAIRAAGGEQVEVVAWMWRDLNGDVQFNYMHPEGQELMTVAQHRRIVSNILGAAKDDQPE